MTIREAYTNSNNTRAVTRRNADPLDREAFLLLTVALDETGGSLLFRSVMADQPDAAVRREYGLAVEALVE